MTMRERTGVMGGTFDPVHLGHLAAAAAAAEGLSLGRVLFAPSHHPPHRPAAPRVSAYHRFAMVSLAVAGDPRFEASDIELCRPGPSFTADTLRRLQQLGHAASQLFFILGTDAFAEIATWHDYPAVLDLACFVVIARPGGAMELLGAQVPALVPRFVPLAEGRPADRLAPKAGQILLVPATTPDVSSTAIRERARRGEELAGLVPGPVQTHIRRHRLYLPDILPPGRPLA